MSLLNECSLWFLEEEEDKAYSSREPYPVPASVLASKEASLEVLGTSSLVVVDEAVSLDEDPFDDEEKTCFEETVQASASSAEDEEEEVDEGQT